MKLINVTLLKERSESLRREWNSRESFRYVVFESFFFPEAAEIILENYPGVSTPGWSNTTYRKQQGKYVMTKFESPVLQQVFQELHSRPFVEIIEGITGIQNLLPDEDLFGAGLHQSVRGAFLDVHVDFNLHPETRFHRRLNILIYMNKNWKKEYNGFLELWDKVNQKQLDSIEPSFNRCVIFETTEKSFHGHPQPLATPSNISRKSISVYYYTMERPMQDTVNEHNTIFMNTQGFLGMIKNFRSGIKALFERMSPK
jgi:2OG-Fe(II) oxygenase superfamily